MLLQRAAEGFPVGCEALPAHEGSEIGRVNLHQDVRAGGDHLDVVESTRAGKRRKVLDDQFILEHAELAGLVDAVGGGGVAAAGLRHRDDAVIAQHAVHFGEKLALVRHVMERIVDHDAIT